MALTPKVASGVGTLLWWLTPTYDLSIFIYLSYGLDIFCTFTDNLYHILVLHTYEILFRKYGKT